ncbi:MAG: CbtB-domain containing protein [Alphaproteobacteria bacterium]|jgi:cobalt transporter subunit CbtB|nr:MAG: CbtB-domain containing protein [Alphaproteobacteria bacterium]
MLHATTVHFPATRLRAALPALMAILFGAFVIYGVGFAGPATIHNAAHDVRHAFAFPCH